MDLKRLRQFCAELHRSGQSFACAEARKIILQHSVQNLLHGLKKKPLPSSSQASIHLEQSLTFLGLNPGEGRTFPFLPSHKDIFSLDALHDLW